MFSWAAKKYVAALTDARKKAVAGLSEEQAKIQIDRFFGKIYFSIRNRGLSPEERALNAAATNAFNFSPVIVQAGTEGLSLKYRRRAKSAQPAGKRVLRRAAHLLRSHRPAGPRAATRALHHRRRRHGAGHDRRTCNLVRVLAAERN
jgi:hypothetical protein